MAQDRKEYLKEYRKNNKDKQKCYRDKHYTENKDTILLAKKEYYEDNKTAKQDYNRAYYEANSDSIKTRVIKNILNKLKHDPVFRFKENTRQAATKSLKRGGYTKDSKTYDMIGCDYNTLKEYIESLWQSWMCWDNYGLYKKNVYNYGWDIDHIIPLSSAKDKEGVIVLNHYTNLQPLCSKVNRDEKRDKILDETRI